MSSQSQPTEKVIFRNYTWTGGNFGPGVKRIKESLPANEILGNLLELTGGWPKRINRSKNWVTIPVLLAEQPDGKNLFINSRNELFAWIAMEIAKCGGQGYDWVSGSRFITKAEFYEIALRQCELTKL